jgi:superfamily II DNA or RNA helicase
MSRDGRRPQLRPYQVADLRAIDEAFRRHRAVCYVAPTGSGKTVLATKFLDRQSDDCIVILAHRDEIVQQICAALKRLGIRFGVIAPDYDETDHRIQVGSVMSVVRRLHRLKRPTLIWIDEAHHAAAETWKRIFATWSDADVIGTTATPRRLDGKPLDDIFDTLVVGPTNARLIDLGFLAPCVVFCPPRSPGLKTVKVRAGDFAVEQLSAVMSNGMIVDGAIDEYERLCPGAPAIAFCVDIKHSMLVADAFRRAGWRAKHLDGNTPRRERRDLIAALADGDLDILSNCGLISEGLDVPGVEAIIGLRPTRSLALHLQMVGRALRPGKVKAFLLDHAGNTMRHGLPTAQRRWTLHGQMVEDEAAKGLRRCPACGAVNEPCAECCGHCGNELRQPRPPRAIIPAAKLAEVVEVPVTDEELAAMGLHAALRWAADKDGILVQSRLERLALARGYKIGWTWYHRGKTIEEVWAQTQEWRRQQMSQ